MRYAFIEEHRPIFSVRAMCRCLRTHPSGFYAWLKNPLCKRAKEDKRQEYAKPSVVVDNTLDRRYDVNAPDQFWVTDITYIKTYEGFSYLAVVIDLCSRRIVGWAMQSRQPTDLVLQALLMAVWRRKPAGKVLVHSDQGSQFTSLEWASFLKHHNLEHSMSRRGNCHERDLFAIGSRTMVA